MKKINEEKFLVAYGQAIEAKENAINEKETAIANAIAEAEQICATHNYSEAIKNTLIEGVKAQEEAKYNFDELEAKVAFFEQFIDIIEDEIIAEEAVCETCGLPEAECTCDKPAEQPTEEIQNF